MAVNHRPKNYAKVIPSAASEKGGVKSMDVEYRQLESVLRAVDAVISAGEAQGMLAGMASLVDKPDKAAWIAQVLADSRPRGEDARLCLAMLVALYERTLRELDDDGLGFLPLLPADAAPLPERAQALGQWVGGFLVGMGLGGMKQGDALPKDVGEALRDLGAITQIEMDAASGEEDESAYAELVEYVKVAVLLVRASMRPPVTPIKPIEADKRLH
jgi:uncharacterized protein YgfB (UPF0149 family)